MRKFDHDGLLLCLMQAELFKQSVERFSCSSDIFVRRFSHSKIATVYDSTAFLDDTYTEENVFDELINEYKELNYGKDRYNPEIMYWMGYIYRYFIYTYEITSKQAYSYLKPKDFAQTYLTYHSLDPEVAIERLLEAKGIKLGKESKRSQAIAIAKQLRNI